MAEIDELFDLKKRLVDDRAHSVEREKEIAHRRRMLEAQEKELAEYQKRLKEEALNREKEFHREVQAREEMYSVREQDLHKKQQALEETLSKRMSEVDSMRFHLQGVIAEREARLQQTSAELEQEKERYKEDSRKKLEITSRDYVSDALSSLERTENQFHTLSKIWSSVGAGGLLIGLVFFAWITASSAMTLLIPVTWEFIVFSAFKGVISVGLLGGLAKYAFVFSNSYMREALKNADRRHAINFGKFYLESYGAAADWSQVKEAFEHWNIAGTNAFNPAENLKIDVPALQKVLENLERVGKTMKGNGESAA